MARKKQPTKQIHQMTIPEWEAAFPDEDACCLYLAEHRWPEFVVCPRCGNPEVKPHGTMKWNWLCNACAPTGTNYRFSHIVGTVFENTNKPLREWFRVIHLMLTSKKGISALQIQRMMGFGAYKTAWYMCHRIRAALANEDFRKLMGIVEVDETFVGGKAHNKHWPRRGGGGRGGIGSGKIPVVGAVERGGKVVSRVIETVSGDILRSFVRGAVSEKVSLLVTDQWVGYRGLDSEYPHKVIRHSSGQYVVGAIYTNTIEGFWSIFKRGVVGTFHKVSAKYMPLYVAEFQFRYNNRENEDIFGEAIRTLQRIDGRFCLSILMRDKWIPAALVIALIGAMFYALHADLARIKINEAAHQQSGSSRTQQENPQGDLPKSFWQRATDDPTAVFTLALVAFTGVLAVATVGLGGATYKLWQSSTTHAGHMEGMLKLARDEFIATHRPSIAIRHLFFLELDGRKDIKILFNLYNRGETKAKIDEIKFFMVIKKHFVFDTIWPRIVATSPTLPVVIEAGFDEKGSGDVSSDFGEWFLKENPKEWEITIRVTAIYSDSAGRRRQTSVYRVYETETRRFSRIDGSEHEYQD